MSNELDILKCIDLDNIVDNLSSDDRLHYIVTKIIEDYRNTDDDRVAQHRNKIGPDGFCLVGDTLYILEHFQIDASKPLFKGEKWFYGKRSGSNKERSREVAGSKADAKIYLYPSRSAKNLLNQLEHIALKHYKKLRKYRENIDTYYGLIYTQLKNVFVVEITDSFLYDYSEFGDPDKLSINIDGSVKNLTSDPPKIRRTVNLCNLIRRNKNKVPTSCILVSKEFRDIVQKLSEINFYIIIIGNMTFIVTPDCPGAIYNINDLDKDSDETERLAMVLRDTVPVSDCVCIELIKGNGGQENE